MAYKNKIYVCFDGDTDIHYYWLMKAWKQNDHTNFNFFDAHNIQQCRDTSQEETIKRSLRLRMANSKAFVVLVGSQTRYLYKYVRWELEWAIKDNLPIVAVNINGMRQMDPNRCPPIIRNELAVHISFNSSILQYALENWVQEHDMLKRNGQSGPFYYDESIYKSLGI